MAGFGEYVVQNRIIFSANTVFLERLTAMINRAAASMARLEEASVTASRAASGLGKSVTGSSAGLTRQARLLDVNSAAMERYGAASRAAGGAGAGGAGRGRLMHGATKAAEYGAVAGLATIGIAATEAGRLQQVLTSVKNITGATADQMERVYQASFKVGDASGMTAVKTAEMFREIVRQTQGSMSLKTQLGMLPNAANLALVMGATRGMSSNETVDATLALTHLFRQYKGGKSTDKMFDLILRMGELMPTNLKQAVTQMTYFLPTLKNLKVSDADAATLMVAMARFGMGKNKGGTSLNNLAMQALGPLQMTKHAQVGKLALLESMGVLDRFGKSKFFTDRGGDIFGFLDQLAKYAHHAGGINASKTFKGAFGAQGSRLADLLSDPVLVEQLHNVQRAMTQQKSLGLKNQTATTTGNLFFQAQRAMNNLTSVMTELGTPWLKDLTRFFKGIGDSLHRYQSWLHVHKDAEKQIGTAVFGITTILSAFVAFATVLKALNIIGIAAAMTKITGAVRGIYTGIGTIGTALGLLSLRIMQFLSLPFMVPLAAGFAGGVTAALIPIPAARGDLSPSEQEREAAANSRYQKNTGPRVVHVHGPISLNVSGGLKGVIDFANAMDSLQTHPQSVLRNSGVNRTHHALPKPLAFGLGGAR